MVIGKESDMKESSPDDIMLKHDTDEPAAPLYSCLGRPMSEEELKAFGKRKFGTGFMDGITPVICSKNLGRKDGKPVQAVFIGIKGTF